MADFADIIAKAKPVTRSVSLCLRGDLVAERERAERDLIAARASDQLSNEPDRAPAIARKVRELDEEIEACLTEFVVKAVGRTKWEALLDANPADDEAKEAGAPYGPGFLVEAIAASCIDPVMSVSQVEQLTEVLSTGQLDTLFSAVLQANLGSDRVPKSVVATATLASSEPKSTTPPLAESLGASS